MPEARPSTTFCWKFGSLPCRAADAFRHAPLETLSPRPVEAPLREGGDQARSEEHTSELQSPCNLVCRLLLEKKKKNTTLNTHRATHITQCHFADLML